MGFSRRIFLGLVAAASLGLGASTAQALTEDQARAHVASTIEQLTTLLETSGTSASRAPELRRIMEERANMPLIAKFSAGRGWREMDENQQSRFTDAFAKFVSETYSRRFDEFSGNPEIKIGKTIDAGRKGILVETLMSQSSGRPIVVEWLVSDRGGRVEIIDMVVEGISMAATQREEIGAMLDKRSGDVDALIADLASGG